MLDQNFDWDPDVDLLRDLMLERELDREIERQAALSPQLPLGGDTTSKVIPLAERAETVIEITELEPTDGKFIGKQIGPDGYIIDYSMAYYWLQSVATVPATISHLFAYLCEARKRNICVIRGAPVDPEEQPILRRNVNFSDTPTRLIPLDLDGVKINWQADPEQAIRTIVAMFGEPWASTSFVWSFSAGHGLEIDKQNPETPEAPDGQKPKKSKKRKRWTGRIVDGEMRLHLIFIAERDLDEAEAGALIESVRGRVPAVDKASCRRVQVNYIRRPLWMEHPDRDPLGDISTIGWIKGTHDVLAIPENLTIRAYWAKAEGRGGDVAVHPDAESAIKGVGSDGSLRSHLISAVIHLLKANMPPDGVSFKDHSITIANELQNRVEQHREEICRNLAAFGRHWSEVLKHISEMALYAVWCLENPGSLHTRTIKLIKEEQTKPFVANATAEEIFARVKRTIEYAYKRAAEVKTPGITEKPPVILLVAPPGSRKSTLMRSAAVLYVTKHPNKTVVILVDRHKLGDEQVKALHREHPNGHYSTAIWRGRLASDPDSPDPEHPGKFMPMCRRSEEVKEVEKAMLDVEHHLCKQGRGNKAIKCPLFDICAFQRQKQVKANIWFAAHECAVHEMPKAFGDVGWVIFDESPLDAFMFGVDGNDQVTLGLDTLNTPLPVDRKPFGGNFNKLMLARKALHHMLNELIVPIDFHLGVAATRKSLDRFIKPPGGGNGLYADDMYRLTWRGKVKSDIRPDMPWEQVKTKLQEAAGNATIKKEATLWKLIQLAANNITTVPAKAVTPEETMNPDYGRIQLQRGKNGRDIRMAGLNELKTGWEVPTLICDATGDAELLKAIWPQLEEPEPQGWQQLPRPSNVRTFQCVNRTFSKDAVAVEGKNPEELERKTEGARRLYAAVLTKALEYGGQDVGVIIYKPTKDWIEKNCFVPEWMKLMHWGSHTGTNIFQKVRALFVVGRWLPPSDAVTRGAEALFGDYIADREYRKYEKQGRIPIDPDAGGNNTILVDVWGHPDPMAERVRRQITEGSLIQAGERARAGLRTAGEPLDIHLWTDIPVPELGPVEPVLGGELNAGLDGLMLATEGVWLKNIADAVKAFNGLFTVDGLEKARAAGRLEERGAGIFPIGDNIGETPAPPTVSPLFRRFTYQRAGAGCKPTEAVFLQGVLDPRGWLEQQVGRLTYFEVVEQGGKAVFRRRT